MTQPIHKIINKRQSHDTHLDPLVSDLLTEFPSTSVNPSSGVISSDVLRLRPFFRSRVPEGKNIIFRIGIVAQSDRNAICGSPYYYYNQPFYGYYNKRSD